MASSSTVLVVFLLSTVANISSIMMNVEAQRSDSTAKSDIISLNSSLSANSTSLSSWLSPSGRFAFGFYPQGKGFAVGIWLVNQPNPLVVWTANRDDPPVPSSSTLTLKRDGLFLQSYDKHHKEIAVANFSTPTEYDDSSASSGAMLDSGNFVVYDNMSIIIWESFRFPTDTILGGQNLLYDNNLVSSASTSDHSSGRFCLKMQSDGNLVAYPVNSSQISENAYWSSGTSTRRPISKYASIFWRVYLSLNLSGFLIILEIAPTYDRRGLKEVLTLPNGSYHGQTGNVIHRATLDVDGIVQLYMHKFVSNDSTSSREVLVWSSLHDRCEVKGTCGLNSYCTTVGNKTHCNCYPGFVINPTDTFLGCYPNSSDNGCTSNHQDPRLQYKVAEMENVNWGDHPYSVVSMKNQQLCSDSCLEDCNCGAVLYMNSSCNKYKLPIRYGRISTNISVKGYIRVALGNVGRPNHTVPNGWMGENKSSKNNMLKILAVTLGSIAFLCFVFAFSSFILYRRRLQRYHKLLQYTNSELVDQGYFSLQSFSYAELEEATDGFKEELGRGSFGAVYKGTLSGSSGNRTVAVKRLEKVVEEGVREFKAEITTIGRTHHRNLVQLLGFCIEGSRKLLVYEYMSNGSLADLLFKSRGAGVRLSWKERVGLVLDVAKGVLYLHDECSVHIIHSNLKPQNILLDHTWTGKISDFGLARLLVPNETSGSLVEQRRSYAAPEWKKNSLISVKSDVYSFGIVLLEIVCCRRNIKVNVSKPDDMILSDWAYKCYAAGELDKLVEEDENVDLATLERMVKVGLWCVQDDPALRPFMKNAILMLEGTMDIPVPPSPGH